MHDRPKPAARNRTLAVVRLMALVSAALAVMCVYLAYAWTSERQAAACWRTAAEFQYQPPDQCRG
ncbi:MAG TPA: hypothetical protein VF474_05760 [Phenylobacterium sp.]